jgi:pyruvate/2-oxoglutarate dehydrogenase complex dihydrolipoamide acyltransferase (E2) component
MSTRNGTSDAIRKCLAEAGEPLSIRELMAELHDAGAQDLTEKQVRAIVYQREQAGEFTKGTRDQTAVYALNPGFVRPARGMAPTTAVLAPLLGAAATPAESPNNRPPLDLTLDLEYAVRDLFHERLSSDTGYTARHVAVELGGKWRTGEVAIALYSACQDGWLQFDHSAEENDNVFSLVHAERDAAHAAVSESVPAVAPEPPEFERTAPKVAQAASAPVALVAIAGIGDVEPMTVAPRPFLPLGLGDRLVAIVNDLEDALGDACDHAVPHGVIKALVLANGAANRALRGLAA